MKDSLPVQVHVIECQERRPLTVSDCLLVLLLKGEMTLHGTEIQSLPEGTMLFLAPFSEKQLYLEPGCGILYGTIDPEIIDRFIGVPKRLAQILSPDEDEHAKETFINYFDLCYNDGSATMIQKLSACFDLLQSMEKAIRSSEATWTGDFRSTQLGQWLDCHFREPIGLDDLAEEFDLTPQYLSTTIHKTFGMPFSTYLRQLRLREAHRLLLTTDKNITTVSEESGFPNLRAFNTAFHQQYGCSPRDYRRQLDLEQQAPAPDAKALRHVNQLLQPYRLLYSKSEVAVSVTDSCSAKGGSVYTPVWRDILNVDISADCLRSSAQETLRQIQSALHFRYVRMGNVFRHELTPYMASTCQHRFTYFFRLVDFFRGIGLSPMLALGESYEVMMDAVMMNDGGYSVAEQDGLQMIEELLKASIGYWGKEWVAAWRFEFRMPARLYGSENPEIFLSFFEKAIHMIKEMLPEAEVGGPALPLDNTHMSLWQAWFQGIAARNLPLDFVSLGLWADYTIRETVFQGQFQEQEKSQTLDAVQNADLGLAVQKVETIRSMMAAAGVSARLYVSALGITPYQARAAQCGGHCGAYLVQTVLALQPLVDGIGCWKAFNHEAEYPDEFQVTGSGCGLLSRYNLKNPNWHAYHFLSQLYPRLLFRGLHCVVTTDGRQRYAVLLHNCKNYSPYFLKNYLTETGTHFTDKRLYTSAAALNQTLILSDAPTGNYRVRQYLIGDHHGCISAVLNQIGMVDTPGPQEISYIAGQSLPYQHCFLVAADHGLKLSVSLQPNEVMLLLLSPESQDRNTP